MFLDLRLKIRHFFRNNKNKIYIVAIIIGLVIVINTYLGYLQSIELPSTNYEPHNPVIYGDKVTDTKTQTTIEEKISEYMNYCNNKEYENAYKCITDECKKYRFNNKLDKFKKYVDYIFNEKKVYSIQDLSNKNNVYVYQVTITEDLLATGLNNEDSELKYQEYIVVTKTADEVKFAVDGYIKNEKINLTYEDEYMTASITEKITYYDKVTYKVKVDSKTTNDIVLANKHDDKEFILSLSGDYRVFVEDPYYDTVVTVNDGKSKEFSMTFNKFFDESRPETALVLNKIRVLKDFSGVDDRWENELKDTVKQYSVTFNFEK